MINLSIWRICATFIFFLCGSLATYAQSVVFTLDETTTYSALNPNQKSDHDRIVASWGGAENVSLRFVRYNAYAVLDANGMLSFQVGDTFLDVFEFKSLFVDYNSLDDFSWRGEFHSVGRKMPAAYGRLQISNRGGLVLANISIGNKAYAIWDLGEGIMILVTSPLSGGNTEIEDLPITPVSLVPDSIPPVPPMPLDPYCGYKTKILVVFTPAAAAEAGAAHLQDLASGWVDALNDAWKISKVYNHAELAGTYTVNSLVEYPLPLDPSHIELEMETEPQSDCKRAALYGSC